MGTENIKYYYKKNSKAKINKENKKDLNENWQNLMESTNKLLYLFMIHEDQKKDLTLIQK